MSILAYRVPSPPQPTVAKNATADQTWIKTSDLILLIPLAAFNQHLERRTAEPACRSDWNSGVVAGMFCSTYPLSSMMVRRSGASSFASDPLLRGQAPHSYRPPDALNRRPTVRNRYTRLQRASQGHLVLGQSAIELGKFKHGQDLHSPSICRSSYPRPDTAPILAMALSSMNPVVQYFSSHSRIRAILDEFITKRRRRRHRRSPWREWSPMVVMSHMHVPRGHQSGPCAAVKTYTFEFRVAMLSICVTNHRRPRALIYDLHSWASLPAEGNEHQLDSLREFEGLSSCVLPMKQPKDAP